MTSSDLLIRLVLFGSPHWILPDGKMVRFPSGKPGRILACVALQAGREVRREALLALLWPESDEASARNNLRFQLSRLRRALALGEAEGILQVDRTALRLDSGQVETDVQLLERAIQARNDERAQSLQTGPLLEGFDDDWVIAERERHASELTSLLTRLGEAALAGSDSGGAERLGQRLVQLDPLSEAGYSLRIRAALIAGNEALARRRYAEIERLLCEEIGVLPGVALRQLLGSTLPTVRPDVVRASPPRRKPSGERDAVPGSVLPRTLTGFFGREEEKALLEEWLTSGRERLVTIIGLGGVGKTRLALELVGGIEPLLYPGGVWWVRLAGLTTPGQIADAVAREVKAVLPSVPQAGQAALEKTARRLRGAPTLLILDNLEHLDQDGLRAVLTELLALAPDLTILTTSRRTLGIAGEQVLPLAPLPVPPGTRKRGETGPGVALFVDRLRHLRPEFRLSAENAPDVFQLCRLLDGIPLALEMAAARGLLFSPRQICEEVSAGRRFEGLGALQKTLSWSYALLSDGAKWLLTQLSVFRGTWTLQSAELLCPERPVAPLLDELCRASLVNLAEGEGPQRFRLLETVREFSGAFLSGDEQRELEVRHLSASVALAKALTTSPSPEDGRRLVLEYEQLSAALNLEGEEQVPLQVELIDVFRTTWFFTGMFSEARQVVRKFLPKINYKNPEYIFEFLLYGSFMASNQGDKSELKYYIDQAEMIGCQSESEKKQVLCAKSNLAAINGNYKSEIEFLEQIVRRCDSNLDNGQDLRYFLNIATAYNHSCQLDKNKEIINTLDNYFEISKNPSNRIFTLIKGFYYVLSGDFEQGKRLIEDAKERLGEMGVVLGIYRGDSYLGFMFVKQKKWEKAHQHLLQAGKNLWRIQEWSWVLFCLGNLCEVYLAQLGEQRALRLMGQTERLYRSLVYSMMPAERERFEALRQQAIESISDPVQAELAWQDGYSQDPDDALSEIFSTEETLP